MSRSLQILLPTNGLIRGSRNVSNWSARITVNTRMRLAKVVRLPTALANLEPHPGRVRPWFFLYNLLATQRSLIEEKRSEGGALSSCPIAPRVKFAPGTQWEFHIISRYERHLERLPDLYWKKVAQIKPGTYRNCPSTHQISTFFSGLQAFVVDNDFTHIQWHVPKIVYWCLMIVP